MDIKEKVEEIVAKFQSDSGLMDKFKASPESAIKGLIGDSVPADKIEEVIKGVTEKLSSGKLGDIVDSVKKLF